MKCFFTLENITAEDQVLTNLEDDPLQPNVYVALRGAPADVAQFELIGLTDNVPITQALVPTIPDFNQGFRVIYRPSVGNLPVSIFINYRIGFGEVRLPLLAGSEPRSRGARQQRPDC